MAIISNNVKGVQMINVVVISNDLQIGKLLEQQADMNVSSVQADSIEDIIEQIGQGEEPNIMVIEWQEENMADKLCHSLSKHFPNARNLILLDDKPTFEMLQNSGFKARGYVTPEQRYILDKAVRVIYDGEGWLPRKLVADMLNRFSSSFFRSGEMET